MAKPRIVLGVTSATSLNLMRGFPEYLAAEGWDVHLVSSAGAESEAMATNPAVTVHVIRMRRNPSPLIDLAGLFAWLRLLRSLRPQVVMAGTPKAGLLGIVGAALSRVPVRIYQVRGLRLETAGGMLRRLLWLLEWVTFKASTSALAVSDSLRERVTGLGLVSPAKIVVLGGGSSNGVDLARFRPSDDSDAEGTRLRHELGLGSTVPVIGFVGRLNRDKGTHVLMAASRILEQRGWDHQILVVGSPEDSDMADDVERTKSARPIGAVADPVPYFRLMDILCLPTLREGFPNVVLEAAAVGVPTVTTDATGAVDSVVNGETGVITEAGNPQALAEGLLVLLANPSRRGEMGSNARERVSALYRREVVWRNVSDFMEGEVSSSRTRETAPS